jgi:hypothetical protein
VNAAEALAEARRERIVVIQRQAEVDALAAALAAHLKWLRRPLVGQDDRHDLVRHNYRGPRGSQQQADREHSRAGNEEDLGRHGTDHRGGEPSTWLTTAKGPRSSDRRVACGPGSCRRIPTRFGRP